MCYVQNFQICFCDFRIELYRDYWTGMPEEMNAKCGWTSPTPFISKINDVEVSESSEDMINLINHDGTEMIKPGVYGLYNNYTIDGVSVYRHHRYNAPQGWSGTFEIDGEFFDVETTTEADIVDFYEIVLKIL